MSAPVVLTLADYYLPGYKAGGPVTTLANVVSRLGDEFRFKLLTRDHDLGDYTPFENVTSNSWTRTDHAEVCYLSGDRRGRRHLRDQLIHSEYDLLYVNSFFSAQFSLYPLLLRLWNRLPDRPVVLAPRGEFAPGALKLKSRKKKAFLRFSKLMRLHRGVLWQASSAFEKADIIRVMGDDVSVSIAPDLVAPLSETESFSASRSKRSGSLRLLFLSRICETKNLLFALRALKRVRGQVEFNIYGPIEDGEYWEQCRQMIEELPKNVTVRYAGLVSPREVPAMMSAHDLFILPTLGENFGHVIIESLSAGCPALISDRTKWKGLEAHEAGWEIPLEDPASFGTILQTCVDMNPDMHSRLRMGARSYAEQHAGHDDGTLEQNRYLFYSALRRDLPDQNYPVRAAA